MIIKCASVQSLESNSFADSVLGTTHGKGGHGPSLLCPGAASSFTKLYSFPFLILRANPLVAVSIKANCMSTGGAMRPRYLRSRIQRVTILNKREMASQTSTAIAPNNPKMRVIFRSELKLSQLICASLNDSSAEKRKGWVGLW